MTEETFGYRFRDGQKEAFMDELRDEAKAYASMAKRRSKDYPPAAAVFSRFSGEAEEILAGLERAEGDEAVLSREGVVWLEIFARFTRAGLFDDKEREYFARCRLGPWAQGQE